jgi:tetratricopeptide (TPR) repeat protein
MMARCLAILVVFGAAGYAQEMREALNQGAQAFRQARYPEAVAKFQQAVNLDPEYVTARLYLATAYMVQWVPGAPSSENDQYARAAATEFRHVLQMDPRQITALASLASMSYNEANALPPEQKAGKFDEARDFDRRIVQLDPLNKEAQYMMGVIAWQKWHPAFMAARVQLGMTPEAPGPLPDASVRESLRNTYGALLEEGISDLEAALRIDPQYSDAMAYMNLLIRERADLRDSQAEHDQDIAAGDQWLQRALEAKRAKARPQ